MRKKNYNMIDSFISKAMQVAVYTHKEGTKTSYYCTNGAKILPNRLSISRNTEITSVQRKGRNLLHPISGQLLGKYRVDEESPLKQHKPFRLRTQLWQVPLHPSFIGYGTIGISDEEGKITDTGDLVMLFSSDEWETISIYYFAGMGNPNDMEQVVKFLEGYIKDNQ